MLRGNRPLDQREIVGAFDHRPRCLGEDGNFDFAWKRQPFVFPIQQAQLAAVAGGELPDSHGGLEGPRTPSISPLDEGMARYNQELDGIHLVLETAPGPLFTLQPEEHTDLIVMCSRGENWLKRRVFGSVAQATDLPSQLYSRRRAE